MWVSSHLLKFTIYFVGAGGQLFWVFDLEPLSYLEHCLMFSTWDFRSEVRWLQPGLCHCVVSLFTQVYTCKMGTGDYNAGW